MVLEYYAYFRENIPESPVIAPAPASMYENIQEPYTVYYNFDQSYLIRNLLSNKHTGIGVQLDSSDAGIKIIYVIEFLRNILSTKTVRIIVD